MIEPNYIYKAKIVNIVDGDTLDADVDLGFSLTARLRLRLNRVNTWEMNSKNTTEKSLARDACLYAADNLLNQPVIIKTQKTDAFGRYLADVYYNEDGSTTCFNDELLQMGLAREYKRST